jgi:hypothetical protein
MLLTNISTKLKRIYGSQGGGKSETQTSSQIIVNLTKIIQAITFLCFTESYYTLFIVYWKRFQVLMSFRTCNNMRPIMFRRFFQSLLFWLLPPKVSVPHLLLSLLTSNLASKPWINPGGYGKQAGHVS